MRKVIILLALLVFAFQVNATDWTVIGPRASKQVKASFDELRSLYDQVGDVWYVNPDVSTSGNGRTWEKAKKTITAALAVAGDDDVIFVAPGDYEEGDPLAITQDNLKIIGPGIGNQNVAMVLVSDSSNHAMTINANNVEIAGLGFTINKDTYSAIMVATTVSAYKTWIHDCRFDGYGQGEYAVHTGSTYDSPDIVVEDCVFRSWQTEAIYANATRGVYRNNTILVDAAKVGIEVVPTTSSRPDQQIVDNVIRGSNSTDTGIKVTNSPNENALVVKGNHVVNCATPITAAKYTSWYDGNYWGVEDEQYHSKARTIFVDDRATTAGDGRSLKSPYKTLTAANAAIPGEDYTLMVEAGSYDEGAAVTITQDYTRIVGTNHSNNMHEVYVYGSAASHHLFVIKANKVLIENVGFIQTKNNYDCIHVGDTDGQAYYQLTVRNCKFDGYDTGEYAIRSGATAGDAGAPDAPDVTIENCHFRGFATACIQDNWTRAQIRNNTFCVIASGIGIEHIPTSGSRPDTFIYDNIISGANSSDTGIKITNTPSAGTVAIAKNYIMGCGTTITQTDNGEYNSVNNYISGKTGGSLLDTDSD